MNGINFLIFYTELSNSFADLTQKVRTRSKLCLLLKEKHILRHHLLQVKVG